MLPKIPQTPLPLTVVISALALSACYDNEQAPVKSIPVAAIVQTIAPDYSNSEVAYLNAETEQIESGYYVKDASDYTISTYKGDIYHIGRYFIDTVTKYNALDVANRDTEIWSYSTQDAKD